MQLTLDLPDELAAALGPQPDRGALEAILAEMAFTGTISVAYAGQVLGLTAGEAIRWYTARGHTYPDLTEDELTEELRFGDDWETK